MTSHGQCPRGGGGACECPRVGGVFQFFGGWMTSRGQCPGVCVLVNVFTPLSGNPVSAPEMDPPPPFKNPGPAPDL